MKGLGVASWFDGSASSVFAISKTLIHTKKKKKAREAETLAERMNTVNANKLFRRGSKSPLKELPKNKKASH